MSLWQDIESTLYSYFSIPTFGVTDAIEIILISILFYYLIIWLKRTSAWTLIKGILVIIAIWAIAAIFQFSTIQWIISNTLNVGIIAVLIIFQPELRRALQQLGRRFFFRQFLGMNNKSGERFSDETLEELIKAVYEMSRTHTGALISIEENISLSEYTRTGIYMDADISSQLLLNIFIDKSPLHDGAVVIRDNKIVAATCYFPLSSSRTLNKKFGTRHRAALGISEQSDACTIVVSEETGDVSLAVSGILLEAVDQNELRTRLKSVQNNQPVTNWFDRFRKGAEADEKTGSEEDV